MTSLVRNVFLTASVLFGLLVSARAIFGPLSFPARIRTPINVESFCAISLMLAFAFNMSRGRSTIEPRPGTPPAFLAALGFLVAAGFLRAIGIYFLADDFVLVKMANTFRFADIRSLLTMPEGGAFFRPVLHLFMALIASWAKFDPLRWHVTGLLLHGLNSVLVFVLALRLGIARSAAFFSGSLFAVHGSLPESVVWITGEYGLLSTFFVLCGLLAFLGHLQSTRQIRWWYGAASLLSMVLAFLTKEAAYVFPLVAVLLVVSQGIPIQRARLLLLLFLVVAAVLFMYRWSLIGGIGGYTDLKSGAPLFAEIGVVQAVRSMLLRLWAVLYFPVNWSREPGAGLGVLFAVYIGALVWMAKERARLPMLFPFGLLCLAALPPIQQLLIGADLQKARALYLPSAGFALMLATGLEPLGKRARWIVPGAILLFHFAALQHNLTAWQRAAEIARRTCTAAARCATPTAKKLSAWNVPGSLDGVYFLGVGFQECVQMQAASRVPEVEIHGGEPHLNQEDNSTLVWNNSNSELSCVREQR
jgi:hypothetical protein